ncbi:MAG: 50S ribosomal protein L18 [Candidatus Omnitrophica bacterium 4484_70.2]|nr:MAG: 50S ribosomal protein L18 [Candidatus Omnitrophica bacterium 4484_70.2]
MKLVGRLRRHERITKKVRGTKLRPRLVVFRSKKHIYAQLVDDGSQRVITGCSTLSGEFKTLNKKSTNQEAAYEIGKLIAKKALELGIKKVCFDRAGYRYHGRIKALAEGARSAGLNF